jgi:hypothetical protein
MKLLKDNKGQIRVIEAFFASILLLSSLTLVPVVQRNLGDSADVLSSTALSVLASLDSNGHLADLVDSEDWTAIRSSVESCIPLSVWFNLTVFDENMTRLNDVPICSGSVVNDDIAAADYVCASTSANYVIYILRLQLAAVD